MQKNDYDNYFKNHYKSSFTQKDLDDYYKWFKTQWNIISKSVTLNKNITILEIGSGYGGFYNVIKKDIHPKNFTGIELDSEAVRCTKSLFQDATFEHISLENFSSTKKYDYIFAFEVLEHLADPILAINKINKLLKKDGLFIGTTPYPYKKNIDADKTHLFVLHPENWKRLFRKSNFHIVKLEPMSFFPVLWRIHHKLNIRINKYIPFKSFVSTTLIIARKENNSTITT